MRKFRIIVATGIAALLAVALPAMFSEDFSELEVTSDRPTMSGSPELGWDKPEPLLDIIESDARARFGTFESVEIPNEADELLTDLLKRKNGSGIVHLSNDDGSKKTLELTKGRWEVRP